MLFCDRLPQQEIAKARGAGRENALKGLIRDFQKAFPELTFTLQLDFTMINAQALKLQDNRIVALYGGLALHPNLGVESLAFILLHEAGHHLAGGCRLRHVPFLACECVADHWAATTGADRLKLKSGRRLHLSAAIGELNAMMRAGQRPDGNYTEKNSGCWARAWSSRSRALLRLDRPPTKAGCCITYV